MPGGNLLLVIQRSLLRPSKVSVILQVAHHRLMKGGKEAAMNDLQIEIRIK